MASHSAPPSTVSPNFSSRRTVSKAGVRAAGGIVVSQHRIASEVGARVLKEGGHAVDAAIATAMAVGVLEPWMSGIGGVGAMVVRDAKTGKVTVVDFGGVSPRKLDPADFPLLPGQEDADLFGWPKVLEDRNVKGPKSVVVPSQPAGLALAHKHFGRMAWGDLLQPAIGLADAGPVVDWHTTLVVANALNDLLADPGCKARYTRANAPPMVPMPTDPKPVAHLPAKELAATLRILASEGTEAYYRGSIARSIAEDMRALGGYIDAEDLAACAPFLIEPLTTTYNGHTIHGVPGLTGGPTVASAFAALPSQAPMDDATLFSGYADALMQAWEKRFDTMGHRGETHAPTCTTHLSVVDRDGNMVSLTQTLLSLFGSRVILPTSGILMNNGINWFDPRPGAKNGIAPGVRVLSNYCPTIMTGPEDAVAIGGCGGRKILPAVFQLLAMMVDRSSDLESTFIRPRIDVSGGKTVVADPRLGAEVLAKLQEKYPVITALATAYPYPFTIAGAVRRQGAVNFGMSEPEQPWADAISEDEV